MVEFVGSSHDAIQPTAGPSIKQTVAKQILGCFQGYGFTSEVVWRTKLEYTLDDLGSESSAVAETIHDTDLTVIFSQDKETDTKLAQQGLVDYARTRAFVVPDQRYPDPDRHGIAFPGRTIKNEDLIFQRVRDEPHIFYLDENLDRRYFYLKNNQILEDSVTLYYYYTRVSDGNKAYLVEDTDYTVDYKDGRIDITKTWNWKSQVPKPLNNVVYCGYGHSVYTVDAINDRDAYVELILKGFYS